MQNPNIPTEDVAEDSSIDIVNLEEYMLTPDLTPDEHIRRLGKLLKSPSIQREVEQRMKQYGIQVTGTLREFAITEITKIIASTDRYELHPRIKHLADVLHDYVNGRHSNRPLRTFEIWRDLTQTGYNQTKKEPHEINESLFPERRNKDATPSQRYLLDMSAKAAILANNYSDMSPEDFRHAFPSYVLFNLFQQGKLKNIGISDADFVHIMTINNVGGYLNFANIKSGRLDIPFLRNKGMRISKELETLFQSEARKVAAELLPALNHIYGSGEGNTRTLQEYGADTMIVRNSSDELVVINDQGKLDPNHRDLNEIANGIYKRTNKTHLEKTHNGEVARATEDFKRRVLDSGYYTHYQHATPLVGQLRAIASDIVQNKEALKELQGRQEQIESPTINEGITQLNNIQGEIHQLQEKITLERNGSNLAPRNWAGKRTKRLKALQDQIDAKCQEFLAIKDSLPTTIRPSLTMNAVTDILGVNIPRLEEKRASIKADLQQQIRKHERTLTDLVQQKDRKVLEIEGIMKDDHQSLIAPAVLETAKREIDKIEAQIKS
ncbi:hypothetical protein CVV38_00630 [Candidatus Peregrinibacteria bacterium HGW-Peregrinibacteria-1]|jgi:hypothetical protein|nr:MAG: hypothetical protein CVV38_00630 [Candidatus Peregrinibacteria bacterium HGW-Peregrinibacteria-1]